MHDHFDQFLVLFMKIYLKKASYEKAFVVVLSMCLLNTYIQCAAVNAQFLLMSSAPQKYRLLMEAAHGHLQISETGIPFTILVLVALGHVGRPHSSAKSAQSWLANNNNNNNDNNT